METLSKAELLMLFSVLEGELEARDLVIEALRVGYSRTLLNTQFIDSFTNLFHGLLRDHGR